MMRNVLVVVLGLLFSNKHAWASSDPTIDASLIQTAAKTNGITDPANPDKFAKSLTSTNNFADFCRGARLTNGAQLPEGSCNITPMGFIPSVANMPSVRIIHPSPDTPIAAKTDFEIVIAVRKISLGYFTSPENTYYLAPQQLNSKGLIKGHLHLVIQLVVGKGPLPAQKLAFFKGISDKQVNGQVKTTVKGGLPSGFYRISTITSAMNHQVVVLPIAKRGAVDDAIYIRVGSAGEGSSNISHSNNLKTVGDSPKAKKHKSRRVCRVKRRKA